MKSAIIKFDRAALVLISILGAVLFLVWARFPDYKTFGQGDPYLDANQYLPGRNFARRGFLKEHLLAEYASGPEECYPLWYTHNPSFSEILSGLYYRAGLREISSQRIIAILWNLLGAAFFYLLLKRLAGARLALFSLAVYISNPFYIAWGDNLFTNHQWCFAFAAGYFFLRSADLSASSRARAAAFSLGAAALSFFLLCSSNYEYVPFVALFFIGVRLLRIREVRWSRILLLLGAGLAAVAFHQFCVIRAIGFDYWLIDKTESLLHRTGLGVTPLMELYRKAPVLMWEEQARLHGSFTLSAYWKDFYLHLGFLFGRGWGILLIVIFLSRLLLPGKLPERKRLRRIILLFFAMSVFWFAAFVQHTADHQWGSTILLFGPFAALLYGSVLAGLYENFLRKRDAGRRIAGLVLISLLLGTLVLGRARAFHPFQSYPGVSALKKYRGRHFISSAIPTLVSAVTGTPTGWMAGNHPAQMLFRARYLVNPDCPLNFKPEFFFSPRHPEDPDFARPYDNWLSANYEIAVRGGNFTIYDLNHPRNPPGPKLINRRGLAFIRSGLPRARPARLDSNPHRQPGNSRFSAGKERSLLARGVARKLMKWTGLSPAEDSGAPIRPISVRAESGNLFQPRYRIYAGSFNSPVKNLCFPDSRRFWHVSMGKVGEPAWAAIDFGENREEIVNFIRVKPRAGFPRQVFKDSVIQGSRDGTTWKDITAVIQEELPSSGGWRGWYFPNRTSYRFYRIFIIDGHEENGAFFSLGALQMYRVIPI